MKFSFILKASLQVRMFEKIENLYMASVALGPEMFSRARIQGF